MTAGRGSRTLAKKAGSDARRRLRCPRDSERHSSTEWSRIAASHAGQSEVRWTGLSGSPEGPMGWRRGAARAVSAVVLQGTPPPTCAPRPAMIARAVNAATTPRPPPPPAPPKDGYAPRAYTGLPLVAAAGGRGEQGRTPTAAAGVVAQRPARLGWGGPHTPFNESVFGPRLRAPHRCLKRIITAGATLAATPHHSRGPFFSTCHLGLGIRAGTGSRNASACGCRLPDRLRGQDGSRRARARLLAVQTDPSVRRVTDEWPTSVHPAVLWLDDCKVEISTRISRTSVQRLSIH